MSQWLFNVFTYVFSIHNKKTQYYQKMGEIITFLCYAIEIFIGY